MPRLRTGYSYAVADLPSLRTRVAVVVRVSYHPRRTRLLHGERPERANTVADGLDIARSTLEWHLDHIVEQEFVDKERDRRNGVTLVLTQPEETAQMLRLVKASMAERFVDRFTRLMDGLLAGDSGHFDGEEYGTVVYSRIKPGLALLSTAYQKPFSLP